MTSPESGLQNHVKGNTVPCINVVLPGANSFSFLNGFTLYQILNEYLSETEPKVKGHLLPLP